MTSDVPVGADVSVVGIVVVTYHSAPVLTGCLDSLTEGCRGVRLSSVVVVDNASRDATIALAEDHSAFPVQTVQLGRNAGYAAAVNAGVRVLSESGAGSILVLNPDTRLRPGSVAAMVKVLAEDSKRGIAVPRLVNVDGSLQPSLRREPTLPRAVAQAILGGDRASRIGQLGELIRSPERYEVPGPAAWATGAAMLIRTDAFDDIGPWDESFLLYSEETDFALRAGDRGWTLWYEPSAIVQHVGGESSTNPMLWSLQTVNRVRLYRRRAGAISGGAYYAVVTAGEAVRAIAGRPTSRAAVSALLRSSRRLSSLPG